MIGALIIGGHVQGLGLIRSLGMEGIPVYCMDTTPYNIGRYSKYCKKFIKMPSDVYDSSENFVNFFRTVHELYNLDEWIIFPTHDLTVAYLSKNKHELSKYFTIWTPDWDCVKYCYDKKLTYKIAESIGISIPKSYFPEDVSDLSEVDYLFQYPLIIKPAIMHEFYKVTKHKAFVVNDKEELKGKYLKACSATNPLDIIIQEIIPGGPENLFSFCPFFKDETVVVGCTARRKRQIPMDFGTGTYNETVSSKEDIIDMSTKVLKAIDYYGLSEVEFKLDQRDNTFKFFEINPRTWKWHSLVLRAGINMPYLLYLDSLGIKIGEGELQAPRIGIKWIDGYTDIYISLKEIISGNLKLSDYIKSLKGEITYPVLSKDDVLPSIAETLLLPYLWKVR